MDKLTLQKLRKWLEMRRDRSTSPYMETEGWRAYHSVLDYLDQHTTNPEPPVNIGKLIEWLKGGKRIWHDRMCRADDMQWYSHCQGATVAYEESLCYFDTKPTDPQTCKTCKRQACEYISGKPMDEWCLHHEPMDEWLLITATVQRYEEALGHLNTKPTDPESEKPQREWKSLTANYPDNTATWDTKRSIANTYCTEHGFELTGVLHDSFEFNAPVDHSGVIQRRYCVKETKDHDEEEPVRERCGTCGYNSKTKFVERKELRYCSWHKHWFTNDSPCKRWRPR